MNITNVRHICRSIAACAAIGAAHATPARITELRVSPVNGVSANMPWIRGDSVKVRWEAPGGAGTVTEYDIRYSTVAITALNWNTRTQVTGEPEPNYPGIIQEMTITGLQPETRYYIAMKAKDTAWSTISNVLMVETKTSDKRVTLSWDAPKTYMNGMEVPDPDVTNYVVYYGPTDGAVTSLDVANVTSARISGLTYGTEYSYHVTAKRGNAESGPSNVARESL